MAYAEKYVVENNKVINNYVTDKIKKLYYIFDSVFQWLDNHR